MSVPYYHDLLADQNRIRGFETAISEAVQPGDVVLEIGTGLGTFALFAARAGASQVFAVDGDPVLHVAQAIAAANDLSERIQCVRGWVPEVDLPTPADVLIFEDFGAALLDTETYRMLRDSIGKYLAPGGLMVPGRATVHVAPLSSEELRHRLFPLATVSGGYGLDWGPSHDYLKNSPRQERLPAEAVAADPEVLYSVDFPTLPEATDIGGEITWEMQPGAVVHALGLWFDLTLRGGGQVTNQPAESTGPWGQVVFPLDPPVVVDESGEFKAQVGNDPTADGAPGWLRWTGQSGQSKARGHEFAGTPADLGDLVDLVDPDEDSGAIREAAPAKSKDDKAAPDTVDNAVATEDDPLALTG